MQNLYFVVEPSQIVAQDLAHAIQSVDPQAQVRLFQRVSELERALQEARPVAVFLHRDPLDEATAQVLQDAGIPFAFTGAEAQIRPDGAAVLASPFTEATVATLLRRLWGQVPEDEDEDA